MVSSMNPSEVLERLTHPEESVRAWTRYYGASYQEQETAM